MTDLKEAMGNVWAGLGLNAAAPPERTTAPLEPPQSDPRLSEIHMELLSSIETLQTRVKNLEDIIDIMKHSQNNSSGNDDYTNAFDLISPEKLLGRRPQPVSIPDDEDVRSVKGFTASPPEVEESLPTVAPEEIETEDEEDDEDEIFEHASEILTYIESYGGAMSNQFKRLELIPNDISDSDRKLVYAKLERLGVKKYMVNKFRHFYYKSEEEGSVVYTKFMENSK